MPKNRSGSHSTGRRKPFFWRQIRAGPAGIERQPHLPLLVFLTGLLAPGPPEQRAEKFHAAGIDAADVADFIDAARNFPARRFRRSGRASSSATPAA